MKMDDWDRETITVEVVLGIIAAAIFTLLIFSIGEADAHDAPPSKMQPTGWTYGWECCSAMDCSQADPASISEIPEGYRVNTTGEIIAYSDKRIKRSKDEFFHRCTHGGKADDPKSICLYVPDRGF